MHIFIEIYVTISVATIHLVSLVIENPSAWYDIVGSLWVRLWRSSLSYIIFDPCLPGQTHFADETKLIIMQSTWSTKLNGMWSDDNVVMLNINIALMIFSHNMPLLPGTSDFCSSAAWRNLTHQQGCFFPISCLHLSTLLLILQTQFIAYHHSTYFVASVLWKTLQKTFDQHLGTNRSQCSRPWMWDKCICVQDNQLFFRGSTILEVWEVNLFWYWWWGCETILQCRGLRPQMNRFWTLLYYWSPCFCITSVHRYSQPTITISRPFGAVVIIGVLSEVITPPHRWPCHDVSKMGKTYRS